MSTPDKPLMRLQIEGMVILKRKSLWVKRWASIKDRHFIYKKEKTDNQIRCIIDLSNAIVKQGRREKNIPYIYLAQKNQKDEEVRISFASEEEFQKWQAVASEAMKSDAELIKLRMESGIAMEMGMQSNRK